MMRIMTLRPHLDLHRSTVLGNITRFPMSLGPSQSDSPASPFTETFDIFQRRRMDNGCCGEIDGLCEPRKRISERNFFLRYGYRVRKKEERLKGFIIVVVLDHRRSFFLSVALVLLLPVLLVGVVVHLLKLLGNLQVVDWGRDDDCQRDLLVRARVCVFVVVPTVFHGSYS